MDLATQRLMQAAAGAGGDPVYLEDVFHAFTYAGNAGSHSVVNGIDNATEGGMVWNKARNGDGGGYEWSFIDTERGAPRYIKMPSQSAQVYDGSNGVSAFNANGYGIHGSTGRFNSTGKNYISYNFRKCPKFFTIVTYTGNGTSNRQIAHDLGCAVGFMAIFQYQHGNDWVAWHRACPSLAGRWDTNNKWNSNNFSNYLGSAPSSTHFTVANNGATNGNSYGYIAYLWAHNNGDGEFGESGDKDIIKCGGFTAGTSNNDININLGFEPQFVMLKKHTTGENPGDDKTYIYDTQRGIDFFLRRELGTTDHDEDTDNNQISSSTYIHPTATGLTLKGYYHSQTTTDWWYVAIRRPDGVVGRPAEAGTDVFAIDLGNNSSTIPCWDSGFPVDYAIYTEPAGGSAKRHATRPQGTRYLASSATQSENSASQQVWDNNFGWGKSRNTDWISYMWKRGPGLDIVPLTATTESGYPSYNHNLGVPPEMIWSKRRDSTSDWTVYHKGINGGNSPFNWRVRLNENATKYEDTYLWGVNANPTSTQFTQKGASFAIGRHIAMLFASVEGISKVGSYIGNGTSGHTITLGFQPRFLIVKSTTQAQDWFMFDTLRGWAAGNDKALKLNSTAGEITNVNYCDPTSTGFQINITGNALNGGSEEYIYYAHS